MEFVSSCGHSFIGGGVSFVLILNCIYKMMTLFTFRFSNVKKCSAGGRALMQLDFTNFMSILELISNQKFTEHRQYVDTFIKAYYFSNEQFEDWIVEQKNLEPPQYSNKQLMNLIQCVCVSDKRTRQKLLNLLGTAVNGSNLNVSLSNTSMSSNAATTTPTSTSTTATTSS